MNQWLIISFLLTTLGGQIFSRGVPTSDLFLSLKNIFFSQELALDLKSYQRSSDQTQLRLNPLKYKSEYLGYLNNFLYQDHVPPQIKKRGLEVKKLLSQMVQEIPYRGQVTQPAMLNMSLDFDTRFLYSLS